MAQGCTRFKVRVSREPGPEGDELFMGDTDGGSLLWPLLPD